MTEHNNPLHSDIDPSSYSRDRSIYRSTVVVAPSDAEFLREINEPTALYDSIDINRRESHVFSSSFEFLPEANRITAELVGIVEYEDHTADPGLRQSDAITQLRLTLNNSADLVGYDIRAVKGHHQKQLQITDPGNGVITSIKMGITDHLRSYYESITVINPSSIETRDAALLQAAHIWGLLHDAVLDIHTPGEVLPNPRELRLMRPDEYCVSSEELLIASTIWRLEYRGTPFRRPLDVAHPLDYQSLAQNSIGKDSKLVISALESVMLTRLQSDTPRAATTSDIEQALKQIE